jgi:hypothetical protein
LVALVASACSPPGGASAAAVESFTIADGALVAPAPGDSAIRIDSLDIAIGHGRLRLGPGALVPARRVGDAEWCAAFSGAIALEYAPEWAVERTELLRATGAETWRLACDGLVLIGEAARRAVSAQVGGAIDVRALSGESPVGLFRALAPELARDGGEPWTGLLRELLEGGGGDYALAIGFDRGKPVAPIELDPSRHEASALYLPPAPGRAMDLASMEPVTSLAAGQRPSWRRAQLVPEHVGVEVRIDDGLGLWTATAIAARMHAAGPTWVSFDLAGKLIVDSVLVDGVVAPSGRIPGGTTLWVRIPEGVERGMACEIRIAAHGRILARDGDWIALESSLGWIPQHDRFQRTTYDLRFRSPRSYQLVAVGDCVSRTVEAEELVSRWVLARPTRNPTFVIGPFDETRLDDPRLPSLTVLMSRSMQRRVRQEFGEGEVGGDLSKQAIADLANAQKFYSTLFGPPFDTTIVAAEIPYLHGESFPGLVNLSWATFSSVTDPTLPQHLRAHEMAHQWWPLGADFASYRDQWLSEGMADFCALWFQQVSAGDPRNYLARLEMSRKDLVHRRWRAAGNPEEASPLALGARIRAKQGQDARTAILYHKGAWVLHMLRNLMLDPRTLRDDRFAAFLRETYQTYRGRGMTTRDVRLLAEKHADEELAWFFRQWVEGTAIPTYRWAWHKEKGSDGRWTVGIRVRASDVPDDFRMPIPVRIDLGEGRSVRYRVEVAGRSGESSLEGLEFEPRQIGFNDLAAVLCEAKEEAW